MTVGAFPGLFPVVGMGSSKNTGRSGGGAKEIISIHPSTFWGQVAGAAV